MADLPETMTVIEITEPGGPDVLKPARRPVPSPGAGEVLIRMAGAGLNGADLSQRQGKYPMPPGVTDIPGLELSGTVAALGDGAGRFRIGDPVCALVPGGGYAEYAIAPEGQCMPVPEGVTLVDAGGLPEACCTVWTNLFDRVHLAPGETVLIQGGTSGIGSTAIQLAHAFGSTVLATARTAEKCAAMIRLGADRAINYTEEDFLEAGKDFTGGRSVAEKAGICRALEEKVWPLFAAGTIKTETWRRFPLADAAEAHRAMETSEHIGKILLTG